MMEAEVEYASKKPTRDQMIRKVLPSITSWILSRLTRGLAFLAADIDLGEYTHPHAAVRHAMDVARRSEPTVPFLR